MALFDFLNALDSPEAAGPLAMLAAAGPSAVPQSVGQRLFGAYMQSQKMRQDAEDRAFNKRYREAQMGEIDAQAQERRIRAQREQQALEQQARIRAALPSLLTPGRDASPGTAAVDAALPPELRIGAQAPLPARAPQFDTRRALALGMGADDITKYAGLVNIGRPEVARVEETTDAQGRPVKRQLDKFGSPVGGDLGQWKAPVQVDRGGSTDFLDPVSLATRGSFGKTGNPFSDLLVAGPDGKLTTNDPLVRAKSIISRAGAANTNVNVNTATKPFLQEVGKGVGEAVNAAFTGAQSAAQTLQNVDQIEKGLGNVIVGPGANARVKLSQLGQVLGVNGKDATEQLQNTRAVMQGLARQELAAAGQMKGQGQITESERGILRRAESGDISELTVPEIQTLLGALRKTSNYRINLHNQNLDRLSRDPNAAGVVDYMRVSPPNTSTPSGFKIIGVQ